MHAIITCLHAFQMIVHSFPDKCPIHLMNKLSGSSETLGRIACCRPIVRTDACSKTQKKLGTNSTNAKLFLCVCLSASFCVSVCLSVCHEFFFPRTHAHTHRHTDRQTHKKSWEYTGILRLPRLKYLGFLYSMIRVEANP